MLISEEELLTYPEDAKPFKDNIAVACFGKVFEGIVAGYKLEKILYLEFGVEIKLKLTKIDV